MSNTTDTSADSELIPSRTVQFWTYLTCEIPSLACILYLLCCLFVRKKLRRALHNHVIIILLFLCFFIETIDNPLYLDAFLHNGRNSFAPSPIVCRIWWLVDYGAYSCVTVFLAWASFERNMLVFYHHRCFGTRRKKILFHYLPLGVLSIYLIGFYIGVMVFPSCENTYNYELDSCGNSPCYEEIPWIAYWDNLVNQTTCILIEAVCNVCLLVRTIHRRYRVQPSVHWRKHRKMTIQLLSISFLSLCITLPVSLLTAIQNTIPGMANFAIVVSWYFYYLNPFVVLLLPLICLASSPDLWPKRWLCKRKRRGQTVAPTQMVTARNILH